MNTRPKTLILFYVLVSYILLQFIWWTYLLTNLSGEVYLQKETELKAKKTESTLQAAELAEIQRKHRHRLAMILGEGTVFLVLLSIGIYRVKKSFEKEAALVKQQKNFLLSVTHELKTPLAAIKLNLQTIQKRNLDKEKQNELLQNSIHETERLNSLIENVLLAARFENSEVFFHKEKINLSDFVKRQLGTTFNTARLETKIAENIFVMADSMALASLITNLAENALKYSDGMVLAELSTQNGSALLQIKDTGPGIEPEERENIFKKFYRVGNEETRKTKGTGLGLFICDFIAKGNDIKIIVANNTPKGTIFQLLFEGEKTNPH